MGRFEQTPFHFVAYHGLSDIAYFMLEEPDGAVKDYLSENGRSITPLHIASRNGNPEIIRSLQRKIDFEFIKEKWLEDSLEEAVRYGHLDCVKQAMTEAAFLTIGRSRTIGYGKIRLLADYRSRMLIFFLIFLTFILFMDSSSSINSFNQFLTRPCENWTSIILTHLIFQKFNPLRVGSLGD